MAEQSSFFNAVINNGIPDRVYKAEIFAQYFSSFIGNGVFPNPSTGLQVLAVDNNMTVRVKEGKGWINGYFYENTDDLILSIDNADGVLNRIERVVLRLDFLNREIRIHVKKGTFSSNPVTPSLLRDANVYELGICDIRVSAGSLQIKQSNITDLRLNSDLCGIVTQTINEIDTTTLYNQLQAHIEEKSIDMKTWIEEAKEFFTNDFNNWFDSIKSALDGDVAGNLLNKINALEEVINTMELTSTKVLRPSGKTVEESISANETSILSLQSELGSNKTTLQNNINEIREVL